MNHFSLATTCVLLGALVQPAAAQLKVTSGNYVGIGLGALTPTEKLDVQGNIRLRDSNKIMFGDANRYVGRIDNINDLGLISRESQWWLRIGSQGGVAFWGGGPGAESTTSPQMFLTTSGGLGINTTSTDSYKLKVVGSALATGYWINSDAKFKTNIKAVDDPLARIMQLNGKEFSYRKTEFEGFTTFGEKSLGFIAQEVEKVVPEAVHMGEDSTLTMNYDMIIPLLVEAIKAQELRIQELEANAATSVKERTAAGASADARLDQSIPNPTSGTVSISYYVKPNQKGQIAIRLMDMSGKLLRRSEGLSVGEQTITMDVRDLPSGEYTYSLILNDQVIATRKLAVRH